MTTETLKTLAGMVQWTGSNLAYNLAKLPADKLDWKPAPEANSALEIVNHLMMPLNGIPAMLEGRAPEATEPAHDLESAQKLIRDMSEGCAAKLCAMTPESLEGTIKMGVEMPRARVATLPLIELIHHHGQIAYIQTLLGDTESHFEEMGN